MSISTGLKMKSSSAGLWMAGLLPLLMVLAGVLLGGFTWGLMDDIGFHSQSGSVLERFVRFVETHWGCGRFLPVWAMHTSIFYKLFHSSPFAFYLFRFCETFLLLGLWGYVAFLLTGRRMIAVPICLAVALSFLKLYDAFFYLSVPEPIGLLFSSIAVLAVFFAARPALYGTGRVMVSWAVVGIGLILLANGCKETFVVLPAALGLSLCGAAFLAKTDKKGLLLYGSTLLIVAVVCVILIKVFLMRGYSAGYEISWAKMSGNLVVWVKKDLWNHVPWVAVLVGALVWGKRGACDALKLFGILLAGCLYVFYSVIVLPWSAWGHYVMPLGIFFALVVVVVCVEFIEGLKPLFSYLIVVGAVAMNVLVGTAAIRAHYDYQRDSQALTVWMAQNAFFVHDLATGAKVRCNASEPASTIPMLTNYLHGTKYGSFLFTSSVREIVSDPQTRYYIWGPFWGDQDLRRLGAMWTPMFWSSHWIVFRRMY